MTIEDELHLLECPRYAAARTDLGLLPHTWSDSRGFTRIKACFNKTEGPDWRRLTYY